MATKLMEVKLSPVDSAVKLDAAAVYLVGPGPIRLCTELPAEACAALAHIPLVAPICDGMGCFVAVK